VELHGGSLGGLSCSTGINVSKVDAPQPADDYPKRQSRPTFQAPPLQPNRGSVCPMPAATADHPLFGSSEVSTAATPDRRWLAVGGRRSSRGPRPSVKVYPQRH